MALSVTAPDRSRLLRDQIRAIRQDLLSGDVQRQRYDQARALAAAPQTGDAPAASAWQAPLQGRQAQRPGQQAAQFAGLVSRVAKFLQTGWTCPSCGHGALPNDRFCHKCGAKIEAPAIAQQAAGHQAGFQASAPGGPQGGEPRAPFCGKCGGPIAPGNTFCTQCGAQRA